MQRHRVQLTFDWGPCLFFGPCFNKTPAPGANPRHISGVGLARHKWPTTFWWCNFFEFSVIKKNYTFYNLSMQPKPLPRNRETFRCSGQLPAPHMVSRRAVGTVFVVTVVLRWTFPIFQFENYPLYRVVQRLFGVFASWQVQPFDQLRMICLFVTGWRGRNTSRRMTV